MTSAKEQPATPTAAHWLTIVFCAVLGLAAMASGAFLLLFMLLANLNLNHGSLTHLAIMVTGWSTIPVCLFCGLWMLLRPSRRSLWLGLIAVVMVGLTFLALYVDGGKGLMH